MGFGWALGSGPCGLWIFNNFQRSPRYLFLLLALPVCGAFLHDLAMRSITQTPKRLAEHPHSMFHYTQAMPHPPNASHCLAVPDFLAVTGKA